MSRILTRDEKNSALKDSIGEIGVVMTQSCRENILLEAQRDLSDRENAEAIQNLKDEISNRQQAFNDYRDFVDRELIKTRDAAIQQARRDTAREIFKAADALIDATVLRNIDLKTGDYAARNYVALRTKYLPEQGETK